MIKGKKKIRIPNLHGSGDIHISLFKEILRQAGIGSRVMEDIEESYYVNPIEMAQIKSDKNLIGKLKIGHRDAKEMKGRFVE